MVGSFALHVLLLAGPVDPLVGRWVMNAAQSRFAAGFPPLKSQTMTCRPQQRGIRCETVRITAAGQRIRSEFTAHYNGQEYPVRGSPEITGVRLERLDPWTVRGRFLKGREVAFAYRIAASGDGERLTITSIDPRTDQDLTSVVVYERN